MLVAIIGSTTPPGRLRRAVAEALDRATAPATLIDLAEQRIAFADGRPPAELGDDTADVVAAITEADAVLLATPTYRESMTGALKNLLDHVPVPALRDTAVGEVPIQILQLLTCRPIGAAFAIDSRPILNPYCRHQYVLAKVDGRTSWINHVHTSSLASEWDPGKREYWKTGSPFAMSPSAQMRIPPPGLRTGALASRRHHSIVLPGSPVTLVHGLQPHHCCSDLAHRCSAHCKTRFMPAGRGSSAVDHSFQNE